MSFWEFIGVTALFDFLFHRKEAHSSRRSIELEDRCNDIYARIDELECRLDECDSTSDNYSDLSDEIEDLYDELDDIEYEQLLNDDDNLY